MSQMNVRVGKVKHYGKPFTHLHNQVEQRFGPIPEGLLLGFGDFGADEYDIMAYYNSRDTRARKYVQKLLDSRVKKK